ARRKTLPPRSIATTVFSNVGGSGFDAIASISASCSVIPRRNAGAKCALSIRSNGGKPYGSALGASNGFASWGSAGGDAGGELSPHPAAARQSTRPGATSGRRIDEYSGEKRPGHDSNRA